MKIKITLILIYLLSVSYGAKAQLKINTDNRYSWKKIKNTGVVPVVFTDADNGDGLNDGAIEIKGIANTPALQGVQYKFVGTPLDGEQINLNVFYYNTSSSYSKFKMQIYNIMDGIVLATTASTMVNAGTSGMLNLSYTFTSASIGDDIMVRFIRTDDLDINRWFDLDYLKINGQFVNMLPLCAAPVVNFDIPLTTATASEINELAAIRTALSNQAEFQRTYIVLLVKLVYLQFL
jgi:hypothetical protein